MGNALELGDGLEWVVDAHGCDPAALRDVERMRALLDRAIAELALHPVGPPTVHAFPGAGGVTALQLLSESHLAVHTFPESGYAALNLYTCRRRPDWPWAERLAELLGARQVVVRRLERSGRAP